MYLDTRTSRIMDWDIEYWFRWETGSEDSLYLNIYSPKTDKKLLPVVLFIHGGAFFVGNSNAGLYRPDYFIDKDVVLVTINYRLGILGLFQRMYYYNINIVDLYIF